MVEFTSQYQAGIFGGYNGKKMPPMRKRGLTATNCHFCDMNCQSMTGISAGTNRRRMQNPLPPAGLVGLIPLVNK